MQALVTSTLSRFISSEFLFIISLHSQMTLYTHNSNQYHIFTKAESTGKKWIEHAVASELTGPYTFVQTGNFAGWGEAEGQCVTILPNGKFRL